ncbi:hypothetical protein GALMADRAFT_705551 [Galerina marginata CBS 339.88]|uniref:Nephrocystin 3-like N-terminal domain-containing protein n=1 Tax=Galerina marginata (strain CBS 339.88) TaxID=685588 RepID=A0A067TYX9_GALM3|nr:hypothetical protein GALMADRAFT_705551 [Galerina marginata CBS 339.88]
MRSVHVYYYQMSRESDSSLTKFFAKAKNLVHRDSVKKRKSTGGSSESSLPALERGVSSSFKSTKTASSSDFLPVSPHKTQVCVKEPQENERFPRTLTNNATSIAPSQFIGSYPTSSRQSLSTTIVPTPWESWKLDQDFLSQVYSWNVTHPENTLNRILSATSASLERHDVLLELIPDGFIPIRGLIKALAHLVNLGTAVAEAKLVALQFAQEVLQWVEKLAAAFGDGEGGSFIEKAWANLADIRKLIEEKGGLTERLSAKDIILEFRERFSQAIERFGVVSQIHIAIGQDHLTQRLHGLSIGQSNMNEELITIRKTQEYFMQVTQKPQSALPDATYQVQKKIPCDPGTRKQVLNQIMDWIFDISEGSPCFFWLSGDPGVGKSAVTASIARECIRRNVLWAQYFINRNDAQTVDPQLYFPSIAKQMSACAPAVDHAVQNTLTDHPYLMKDDISLDQATKLFVDTIRLAAATTPTMPVAIVIDALDETDQKRLKLTADVFSRVLVDLPFNAKVFISSRVETVIRDKFATLPRTHNIHLSARNSVADVTAYLELKVDEIMTEHHISWSHWGQDRMHKLCSQASGLFIWAVTAIKYIQAQIEDFGTEQLDMVLDELNTNGMQDINSLYITIIHRTYPRDTPWQNQCFRRIVGAILAQQTPLSIDELKGLLDLRNPTNNSPVDVEHFVRRLRTILVPGIDEITGRTVPRVHKSFSDFITSVQAEEFRVNLRHANGELALQCINRLERLWEVLRSISRMMGTITRLRMVVIV